MEYEDKLFPFNDLGVQNKINQKLCDAMFGVAPECVTTTVLGSSNVNTESLTEERLLAVMNKIAAEFEIKKEDTIKWLGYLGFRVMVNNFMEDGKPIIMLPKSYANALKNVQEEHHED